MLDNVLKNEIKHEKVSFFQYLATSFLWAESVSPFFQYLFLYGSHIQLLAILYWGQFKFALPLGYNSFLEIIPKVTGILTCQSINSSTTSYEIGITLNIISYIYLLLFFLVVAFIITRFYSRKDISRRVRVLVNPFSHFHMTIGFWIINVILMYALSTAQNEESWEYGLISLDIFHFILIVFNYFIGIISAIFSFDPLSTSNILSSHSPVF